MEKETLLTQIEQANTLETLYPLWNELKTYLDNQPSLLELGKLFGYQYHLSEKLQQLSLAFLQEKKDEESIAFHQELITYFKDDKYLCPFYKNLALSYFSQDIDKGLAYFQELLNRYPYDYDLLDAYFTCLFKQNRYEELKTEIQKQLPLSIEYNIETENIIRHVVEFFKDMDEEELALRYAQIERKQNDFGKKKPTKVIKVGRNDPCPCGSGKKYKKCCGK